jgi:hypothetical protein
MAKAFDFLRRKTAAKPTSEVALDSPEQELVTPEEEVPVELPPAPPAPEPEVVAEPEVVKPPPSPGPSLENLDKDALMKFCFALGMGNHTHLVGVAGVRRIGQMFGATTYEQELAVWKEIKNYVLTRR